MKGVFLLAIRRTIGALIVALCLVSAIPISVSAQSPSDYFSFSYDVQFSKSQVSGNENFRLLLRPR